MRPKQHRLLLVLGLISGSAFANPVSVVRDFSKQKGLDASRVLYKDGDFAVVKSSDATAEDFKDLYVVDATRLFAIPEHVAVTGEVQFFEPGRFALMRVSENKVDRLSSALHGVYAACGPIMKLTGVPMATELRATPSAVLPIEQRDTRVQNAIAKVAATNIKSTIEELSAIFTRYHSTTTGQGVALLVANKYRELAGTREDVEITTYDHGSATPQDSLVVRIKGKSRPNEVIVLGSHIDSVNLSNPTGGRSPGADDNASGTATNLEIFRILMEQGYQPARTVEIHGYAAEELGLVGSQDIANDYKAAGVNVVAMLQHDMTLWKASGDADKIWLVTSNTDAGFNDLLGKLIDSYVGMPWGKAALFGGTSDHASWRRAGYASAFPFENPNNYNHNVHTANDSLAQVRSFDLTAGFAKLGLAYVMHFGGVE